MSSAATEKHRHACECRHVLNLPDREARVKYIDGVRRNRGNDAAQRLQDDVTLMFTQRQRSRKK